MPPTTFMTFKFTRKMSTAKILEMSLMFSPYNHQWHCTPVIDISCLKQMLCPSNPMVTCSKIQNSTCKAPQATPMNWFLIIKVHPSTANVFKKRSLTAYDTPLSAFQPPPPKIGPSRCLLPADLRLNKRFGNWWNWFAISSLQPSQYKILQQILLRNYIIVDKNNHFKLFSKKFNLL